MSELSHSQRLQKKIEHAFLEVTHITTELIEHPCLPELYPQFLVQAQQMTRATVPLMECAVAQCRKMEHQDPIAASLIPYLLHHIEDEQDHDIWTLEDLELLGIPRQEVLSQMPSPNIASYIGAQYYWIMHHHPIALLGDFAVREGYPPTQESIDFAVERTGLPRKAFRTIEQHGILDQGHKKEFAEFLDSLPLEESHHEILGVSAFHSMRLARQLVEDILNDYDDPAGC